MSPPLLGSTTLPRVLPVERQVNGDILIHCRFDTRHLTVCHNNDNIMLSGYRMLPGYRMLSGYRMLPVANIILNLSTKRTGVMIWTFLTRFATVATTAWLVLGNAPFSQNTSLALALALLLLFLTDLFNLLPSQDGTSA